MVYLFGPNLPLVVKSKLQIPSEDIKNPKNYVKYSSVKETVDKYNQNKSECDTIYLHEICKDLFMFSEITAISRQWDEDRRPEYIKEEHRLRSIRVEDMKYRKLTKDVMMDNHKQSAAGKDSIKDYEKSMSFAMSFIFSIFASALVGYYLGIYLFSFTHEQSLVMAVFFLVGGLMLETLLYIIKITKDQQIDRLRKIHEAKLKQPKKVDVQQNGKQKKD